MIKIKKGLELPIAGKPEQVIEDARAVRSVAVLGDYAFGYRDGFWPRDRGRVRNAFREGSAYNIHADQCWIVCRDADQPPYKRDH